MDQFVDVIDGLNCELIYTLYIIIGVVDVLTGVVAAFYNKKWRSKAFHSGLFKHIGTFIVITALWVVATWFAAALPAASVAFIKFVMAGFAGGYIGSIVENLNHLGVKVPVLTEHLEEYTGVK